MLSATKAVGQKKRFAVGKSGRMRFKQWARKSDSLWAAVFATNKQDKTNVEIVPCGRCNQGLWGAFHNQMGKFCWELFSWVEKGIWLREIFFAYVNGGYLIKITSYQCYLSGVASAHMVPHTCPQCPLLCSPSCMPQSVSSWIRNLLKSLPWVL